MEKKGMKVVPPMKGPRELGSLEVENTTGKLC